MKRILLLVLFLAACVPVHAQNSGALLPDIVPVFPNLSGGGPAANGFLCTTASGTNTSLLTYRDAALTTANQNPIRLNAAGRPVNGSTEVSIFIQARAYRATLYAAGTGNTCNGTSVGVMIKQVDNVYDFAQLFGTTSDPWFDVKLYGRAKGDCSTDDTSAIATTITAASAVSTSPYGSGAIVYFPPGCYHVTSVLTVSTSGVRLVGAGAETSVITTSNVSGSVITLSGGIQNVSVEKLSIRANPARNVGAVGITINGAGGLSYIRNVWLYDQPIGISVLDTSPVLTFDIEDVNINTTNLSSGIGIDLNGGVGVGIYNAFITATTSYAGDQAPFVGVRFLNTNNSRMYGGRIQYFKWGVLIAPGSGVTISQNEIHQTVIESSTHEGIGIEPSGNGTAAIFQTVLDQVRIDKAYGNLIGAGPCIRIADGATPATSTIKGTQIINPTIWGCSEDGIIITAPNATDTTINGGTIGDNSSGSSGTYNGITIGANVASFDIQNVRSGYVYGISNTQGYGVSIAAGTGANYTVLNNDLRGNVTGGLNAGATGAGKNIQGNQNTTFSFIPGRLIVSDNALSTEPSISGLTSIQHWISKDATAETFLFDSFGTNNSILMRRADGTLAAPTAVQSGEDLGHIGGGGYQSGGAYTSQRATIEFHASENWTNSNQGADIQFWDTPLGSTTPHLIGKFGDNGGNGQFLVNGSSSDFASCILCSVGTIANVSATTNAKVLALNASGGDGKSQIVVTKSGTGTTQPLEVFSDSTLLATFQPAQALKIAGTGQTIGTTVGTFAQLPGSPTEGDCKAISDGNSATFMAVAAGGGANHVIVCYDAANWRIH